MSEQRKNLLAWVFVGLTGLAATAVWQGGMRAGAADDHDEAEALRTGGDVLPLAEILNRAGLADQRVLEAELERRDGRMVYELEVLGADGRVRERHIDAATGEALGEDRRD